MLNELIAYASELKSLFESGKSLREISQWSYQQRESGRNIPYMAIMQTAQKGRDVIRIVASPTSRQKELKSFFSEPAPGSVLDKYSLFIDIEDGGVFFTERLGKGKGNFINLI